MTCTKMVNTSNSLETGKTMRVYHLLPRKWALDDLEHGRLKVAKFEDLNDPFELRGVNLGDRTVRTRFNRWRKLTSGKLGLLCFSKNWRNPVLWSHYADQHRGICLGFDVPADCLDKVEYVPHRLRFEQLIPSDEQLLELLRTKYKDWAYEAEFRRILRLEETYKIGNRHFRSFGADLALREVVLGARCTVKKNELERLVGERFNRIELVQARAAFQTFNVVTDQRGVR